MLLEIAVGDAYGAGFEYNDRAAKERNDLSAYIQHPRHLGIKPGMYTDDTQMSIAIAEALIAGDPWTPLNIATKFVECFKRDFRDGYARGFQAFLESVNSGEEFLEKILPESEKSGAAMRAGPIGRVSNDPKVVIELATVQAEITHKTKKGVDAAVAAALFSFFCWNTVAPRDLLPAFLNAHVPGYQWDIAWKGKVGAEGISSVKAAITAFMATNTLSDMLKSCVALTGDTDTVASIAMSAASGHAAIEKDLPNHLISSLENGAYGRSI